MPSKPFSVTVASARNGNRTQRPCVRAVGQVLVEEAISPSLSRSERRRRSSAFRLRRQTASVRAGREMEANRSAHARQSKSHRGCCRMHPQKALHATAAAGSRATDATELANAFVGQRGTAEFGRVASGMLSEFRPLTVASRYKFQQSSRPSPLPFTRLCICLSQVLRTSSRTPCLPTQLCSSSPLSSASMQQDPHCSNPPW